MKRFFVATVGFGLLVVLAAVGAARADFALTGSEHLDVSFPSLHSVGILWDSSSADVRGGRIERAYVNDQARLGIFVGGKVDYAYAYNSSAVDSSGGTIAGSVRAYDTSTVNISGGLVTGVYAAGSSTVNISDAVLLSLSAQDSSTLDISSGIVSGSLSASGTSTLGISGGNLSSVGDVFVGNSSTVNISGGIVGPVPWGLLLRDSSTLNISGGTVEGSVFASDASTVAISGGTIGGSVSASGTSTVAMSGGSVSGVGAGGTSTVAISGGTVSGVGASDTGIVTFYGYDFRAAGGLRLEGERVFGTGPLTGKWFDGTPWIVQISASSPAAAIWALPAPPTPPEWKLTTGGSYNYPSNWAWHVIPNGLDAEANFLGVTTVDSTVTVDSPVTLGTINFDHAHSYTLAGPAEITLETSGGDARINVRAGHHTISAPLSLAVGLTVDTQAATSLTVHLEDLAVVSQDLTKKGAGTWVVDGGLALLGGVDVQGGTLEVGRDLLANPGGSVILSAGATLKTGGSVNRHVIGSPGSTLEAVGVMAVGVLDDPGGYDFQGRLEVGPHTVGLMDADQARVYETHLGGGSLSSFNGIGLQAVDVFGTLGTHEGWLTGHGTVKGAVRFEVEGANFAALAGDGPGQEIVLDGVVSGSSLLEWVVITGLHRPGASAGFTGLGQGTNIGPGATLVGIDGPHGFWTPDPSPARGYDQWFAMFGQHAISGDLTMKLEAPTPGGEIHVPDPSVRYEIFKSYAPGGNPVNAGWYIGWFNNVTLDPSWPNPTEWVWEFDYLRGGLGHGTAPDPGRAFYSATLMVIPEPSTLVLLSMGALVLTVSWWRRRRARTALA